MIMERGWVREQGGGGVGLSCMPGKEFVCLWFWRWVVIVLSNIGILLLDRVRWHRLSSLSETGRSQDY